MARGGWYGWTKIVVAFVEKKELAQFGKQLSGVVVSDR